MHTSCDMVEPIRDYWMIALAMLFAGALLAWLVATRWR
jgi:hypothetical protein